MKFENGGYARRVPPAGHFNLHWCPTADTFAIAGSFADEIQVLCPTAGTVSGFNTVNTLCLTVLRILMSFRIWLEQLRNVRGHRPLWPVLLGAALDSEFQRQRSIDESYKGDVFKNRDDHQLDEGEKEERLIAFLYRSALAADGCLHFESQRIWLLGFQWPTQGGVREIGRRADLIGMTINGGLVLFEAKRANGDAPMIAIAEGLDYLACLLRHKNFEKDMHGLQKVDCFSPTLHSRWIQ